MPAAFYLRRISLFHAAVLAGTVPLFGGVLLSDAAYYLSHEIQWKNFSSWLIAGALVFVGVALLAALVDLVRGVLFGSRALVYIALLLGTFVLGFINALIHSRDAWDSMPLGLYLSAILAVGVIVATWTGFSTLRWED